MDTLEELLKTFSIDSSNYYTNPNMVAEQGISLYGVILTQKLHYIEVESRYRLMQKRAIDEGYKVGDLIPTSFEKSDNKIL